MHEPIGFELSGVPTKEISILRYREGPGWLEIYPIAGKPLSGIVFHSEDLPLGVAGSVNHIYDQWLRINAHLYPQDPMFKVIQQAVGHLGERSTVTVSGTYSERRTERFVFPGPYFASDGSLLHEKLEHARKNPLQG